MPETFGLWIFRKIQIPTTAVLTTPVAPNSLVYDLDISGTPTSHLQLWKAPYLDDMQNIKQALDNSRKIVNVLMTGTDTWKSYSGSGLGPCLASCGNSAVTSRLIGEERSKEAPPRVAIDECPGCENCRRWKCVPERSSMENVRSRSHMPISFEFSRTTRAELVEEQEWQLVSPTPDEHEDYASPKREGYLWKSLLPCKQQKGWEHDDVIQHRGLVRTKSDESIVFVDLTESTKISPTPSMETSGEDKSGSSKFVKGKRDRPGPTVRLLSETLRKRGNSHSIIVTPEGVYVAEAIAEALKLSIESTSLVNHRPLEQFSNNYYARPSSPQSSQETKSGYSYLENIPAGAYTSGSSSAELIRASVPAYRNDEIMNCSSSVEGDNEHGSHSGYLSVVESSSSSISRPDEDEPPLTDCSEASPFSTSSHARQGDHLLEGLYSSSPSNLPHNWSLDPLQLGKPFGLDSFISRHCSSDLKESPSMAISILIRKDEELGEESDGNQASDESASVPSGLLEKKSHSLSLRSRHMPISSTHHSSPSDLSHISADSGALVPDFLSADHNSHLPSTNSRGSSIYTSASRRSSQTPEMVWDDEYFSKIRPLDDLNIPIDMNPNLEVAKSGTLSGYEFRSSLDINDDEIPDMDEVTDDDEDEEDEMTPSQEDFRNFTYGPGRDQASSPVGPFYVSHVSGDCLCKPGTEAWCNNSEPAFGTPPKAYVNGKQVYLRGGPNKNR